MKYIFFVLIFLIHGTLTVFSQQSSYFDAAQSYNRLLIEKNTGAYQRISNYKVIGTSYLFGELNTGDIYSKNASASKVPLRYNTYTQQVEFSYSANSTTFLKEPGTLDSFIIKKNESAGLVKDLCFIYAKFLGSKSSNYYQVVIKGKKVNLYKKYYSELGIVSTNYVQSELRQFNLIVEYFFTDSNNTDLKKLKNSAKQISKQFAVFKDLTSFISEEELVVNKESELIRIFKEINEN